MPSIMCLKSGLDFTESEGKVDFSTQKSKVNKIEIFNHVKV